MARYKTTPGTRLVSTISGLDINVGDEVEDFRGDWWTVKGWTAPRHPASSGRVYLSNGEWEHEYFPGVISAQIVNAE